MGWLVFRFAILLAAEINVVPVTLPKEFTAIVPSWQDRHSLEVVPGCPATKFFAVMVADVYGV
jgi:hypothetical protein